MANNNGNSRKSRKVEYVPKKQYQIMNFFVEEYQKRDSVQDREERCENRKLYGLPLTDMEMYSNFNLFKTYLDKDKFKEKFAYKNPVDIIKQLSGEYRVIAFLEWRYHVSIQEMQIVKGELYVWNEFTELTRIHLSRRTEGMVETIMSAHNQGYRVDRANYADSLMFACYKADEKFKGSAGFVFNMDKQKYLFFDDEMDSQASIFGDFTEEDDFDVRETSWEDDTVPF